MARTGGRNTGFAWFVGIVTVGIVAALVWFAAPAFPAVAVWIGDQYRNATGTGGPIADAPDPTPTAGSPTPAVEPTARPADCASLYPETLWALLSSTAGAELTEGAAIPDDATELAAALAAADPLACRWAIPTGQSITTVVAVVGDDAPDIAATFLGTRQFACTATGIRTDCVRDADGRVETHQIRNGIWVISIQDGWSPPDYAEAVAARIWPE